MGFFKIDNFGNHLLARKDYGIFEIKCSSKDSKMPLGKNPSLEACPICGEELNRAGIKGFHLREGIESLLEEKGMLKLTKQLKKDLEITKEINRDQMERIVRLLEVKPTMRGDAILSEIQCLAS